MTDEIFYDKKEVSSFAKQQRKTSTTDWPQKEGKLHGFRLERFMEISKSEIDAWIKTKSKTKIGKEIKYEAGQSKPRTNYWQIIRQLLAGWVTGIKEN